MILLYFVLILQLILQLVTSGIKQTHIKVIKMVANTSSQKAFVYFLERLGYSQWAFYSIVSKIVGLVSREDTNCSRYSVIHFKLATNYLYCHMPQTRCETIE